MEKLDNVVKELQGYILLELAQEGKDTEKIAGYIQSIRVINNKFDSSYTTNLEKYRTELEKSNYIHRLPLRD